MPFFPPAPLYIIVSGPRLEKTLYRVPKRNTLLPEGGHLPTLLFLVAFGLIIHHHLAYPFAIRIC